MKKILLVLTCLSFSACSSDSSSAVGSLLGGEKNATTELRGDRPGVLYFWSDDCESCTEALPLLDQLQQEFPDFSFVAVYVGDHEAEAKRNWQNDGMQLIAQRTDALWKGYMVNVLPTTLFLSSEGLVISRIDGPAQHAEMLMRAQEIADLEAAK